MLVERHERYAPPSARMDGRKGWLLPPARDDRPEVAERMRRAMPCRRGGDTVRPADGAAVPRAAASPGKERHWLALTCHHVVSDGLSIAVLVDELARLYGNGGTDARLPPAPPFADFVRWHLCERAGEAMRDHEAFLAAGTGRTADRPPVSYDRPRPAVQTFRGDRRTPPADRYVARLDALARGRQATPSWSWAAHLAHLHRLTGQNDIVIGVPVAGRGRRLGPHGRLLHPSSAGAQPLRRRYRIHGLPDAHQGGAAGCLCPEDNPSPADHPPRPGARSGPPLLATVFNIDRPLAAIASPDSRPGYRRADPLHRL